MHCIPILSWVGMRGTNAHGKALTMKPQYLVRTLTIDFKQVGSDRRPAMLKVNIPALHLAHAQHIAKMLVMDQRDSSGLGLEVHAVICVRVPLRPGTVLHPGTAIIPVETVSKLVVDLSAIEAEIEDEFNTPEYNKPRLATTTTDDYMKVSDE